MKERGNAVYDAEEILQFEMWVKWEERKKSQRLLFKQAEKYAAFKQRDRWLLSETLSPSCRKDRWNALWLAVALGKEGRQCATVTRFAFLRSGYTRLFHFHLRYYRDYFHITPGDCSNLYCTIKMKTYARSNYFYKQRDKNKCDLLSNILKFINQVYESF
ncbi:hypothetical protein CEXT_165781 [Caerostris extrusa]|uniref:Uncharacterized protein n=1 Tax=Caerostris extrusa TaxID=172846 RepID=A0AAV4U0T9_CAEEX|nr:hypothetical protein CEXT_165781 [Caerostris extrusa]